MKNFKIIFFGLFLGNLPNIFQLWFYDSNDSFIILAQVALNWFMWPVIVYLIESDGNYILNKFTEFYNRLPENYRIKIESFIKAPQILLSALFTLLIIGCYIILVGFLFCLFALDWSFKNNSSNILTNWVEKECLIHYQHGKCQK